MLRVGSIPGFAYNGQVPGPTIEANVGDTIEVRLKNSLPQATTIHWHGIRVPAEMDGTEAVQPPVRPGETFEYRFRVPDAGTYWYHSHSNETEQLERGLYGALIVRDPNEPTFDAERILHFDDLKLGPDGDLAPFGDEHEHHAGREGDVRLVNGRQEPELRCQEARSSAGASSTRRTLALSASRLADDRSPSSARTAVSCLSQSRQPRSWSRRASALTSPWDRFGKGERIEIEALPYDRGKGETARERFAALQVGAATESSAHIPETLRQIDPLVDERAEPTRTIDLKALMHAGHHQRAEPVRVGELQVCGISSMRLDRTTRSTSTASSFRSCNKMASRRLCWRGRTPSTCRGRARRGLRGYLTIDRASGCTTATSSNTMRWE